MSNKTGRPAGPAKTLWRKRLTAEQVAAVEAFLDDAVVYVTEPDAHTPQTAAIPSKSAWAGHEVVLPAGSSLPVGGAEKNSTATPSGSSHGAGDETIVDGTAAEPLPREYFKAELERTREQLEAIRKKLCGVGLEPKHHDTPEKAADAVIEMIAYFRRELVDPPADLCAAVLKKIKDAGGAVPANVEEQLALQSKRADGLQAQVDELQHALDRKEVELEQLMQTGGTERQSAYIARLQDKIVKLGGNRSEFDQEGGR